MELDKVYEPQRFEPRWAQWWIDQGVFRTRDDSDRPMYSLVIPPPNVTGSLHMGHMLEHTEIDVTIRWHRMRGENTLWLPGMDHAGIATQMVVERQLRAEGVSRHDLGREKFEQRVWEWKEQYGGTIVRQMIRLGASCDWSRERFTMDEGLSPRRPRGLRPPARKGPDLPRRVHDQLVPAVPDGAVGSGGSPRPDRRQPVAHPVSGQRQRPLRRGRHDPARDDARRHGLRCPPRRRALPGPARQATYRAAAHEPRDPGDRR